jgi:hypothetical protein
LLAARGIVGESAVRIVRIAPAIITALLIGFNGPAFAAEATTGTLEGSVTTVTGKPIAGARVAAASPSGRASAVTDEHGEFVLL